MIVALAGLFSYLFYIIVKRKTFASETLLKIKQKKYHKESIALEFHKRMKMSGRPNDIKKFQEYKRLARSVSNRTYELYLCDILRLNDTTSLEENFPT